MNKVLKQPFYVDIKILSRSGADQVVQPYL